MSSFFFLFGSSELLNIMNHQGIILAETRIVYQISVVRVCVCVCGGGRHMGDTCLSEQILYRNIETGHQILIFFIVYGDLLEHTV